MRERTSLDKGWRFALGHASDGSKDFDFRRDRSLVKAGEGRGAASPSFDDSGWRTVELPHDWAIELPLDPDGGKELAEHGFRAIGPDHPEHSVGWYRTGFDIPEADLGRRIAVEFDGVFRDSVVWINGHRIGRHESGHTSFRFDVTDHLVYGGRNTLVVRCDASSWEGWWYEGAGIYRHVWLTKTAPLHVAPSGTFVTTEVIGKTATVTARTTVANESDTQAMFTLRSTVESLVSSSMHILDPWQSVEVVHAISVPDARLWSCETPNLYSLQTEIESGGQVVDRHQTTFGVRTLRWDANEGFFLNDLPVKIKGTCNHQQHAGVGTAVPDELHFWRLRKLKAMGSNAYRCSHYAVAPEVLDECDRLGLLVMAENRLAGGGPEFEGQLRAMVKRDRNHPSVILWSLGNEEHTVQWSITGERIGKTLARACHELDPTRAVTSAMHDRGFNEGFMHVVDVHGWNYIGVGDILKWRERNPHRPIVGSEEASTVCTRGIYIDDAERGYVSAYDRRTPKWGSTAEKWWTFFAERPWLAGGFVWTGFDYFGEPIPYKWPCTASHFGLMDMCGFPKDNFYYYKAWWGGDPVLHLFPHWNWPGRDGEAIDVRCFTNCDSVELFLNGASLGRREVPRNSHVAWSVNYTPGMLEAVGHRDGVELRRTRVETTGEAARLELIDEAADFRDIAIVAVRAVDAEGRIVPTANDFVEFTLEGGGRLLGVGNGDPSSHEPDQASSRSLFNGLAQAIVQRGEGPVTLRAASKKLASCTVSLRERVQDA